MAHLHLLLLLLLLSPTASSSCLPTQSNALLSLKRDLRFTHRSASNLTSWIPTTDCCTDWQGVNCSDPRSGLVTALDLSSLSISGTLSPSLFNLTALVSLNLAYNLFHTIPFPDSFNLLSNLTHLNLSNAGFAGQVPAGIAALTRLVSLDLSTFYLNEQPDSQLKLHDPDVRELVKNLHSLRELYLDGVNISLDGAKWGGALAGSAPGLRELSLVGCSLSGPIHASLAELRSVQLLRLDQNRLDCPVPDFLGNFSALTQLSLSSCGLTGKIPATIFKIRPLTVLDVSNNPRLTGSLPGFPKDSALESLVLLGTGLSGALPESIGGLKSLVRLELMKCKFSGPLPAAMGNLTQLVYLDLSFNNFSGEIPSELSWWRIAEVVLTNNSLNGSIPVSLGDQRFRNLTKLDLQYNLLTGSIPPSLFSMPSLQVLQLGQNKLSGRLPEFLDAPLSTVDLSSNNIQGGIPTSIFNLSGLKILGLSSNNFSGEIELSQFAGLRKLSSLDLSNNRLWIQDSATSESSLYFPKMGTLKLSACNLTKLPALLRNQTKLSILDLSNNMISGVIPNWIWGIGGSNLNYLNLSCNLFTNVERPLSKLSTNTVGGIILDLHSNKLQGPIPLPPTYTIVLDYSNNNFSSIIPVNISLYLTFTIFFSLSNNTLTGAIPPSICNAANLNVLDLGFNKLSGSIPPCLIENMTNLRILNLRENQLNGTISDGSSEECSLETVNLNNNQLGGKLPSTLSKCTMLEVLDLGKNHFRDTFPYWLSNLSQLQVLVMSSNRFYGAIGDPEFAMLRIFDLSSNNFDGNLSSKCFGSLESMKRGSDLSAMMSHPNLGFQYLYFNSHFYQNALTVTFKNQEITLVKSLTVFTYIDLSDNKFQYKIPQVIGELTWLFMLNMSHNSLTGWIPDSLGGLVELESLDLSSNRLSGEIPRDLVNLTFLAMLNLSYNELGGRIPQGGQLSTFDVNAYEGNKGLCGAPLARECSGMVSPPESRGEVVGQPSWEFVVVGVAFGAGLAAVFGGLHVYEGARRVFEEKVDRVMWVVMETVGWCQESGKVSAVEEVEEGDRRYCLFCTFVEVHAGMMMVRHRECKCMIGGS